MRRRANVESPAKFSVNLPRVVVMKTAERQAVIQQHAAIADVQRGDRNSILIPFAESFSDGKVERGVPGQVIAGILRVRRAVVESRAIVHVRSRKNLSGEGCVEAGVQRVPLIATIAECVCPLPPDPHPGRTRSTGRRSLSSETGSSQVMRSNRPHGYSRALSGSQELYGPPLGSKQSDDVWGATGHALASLVSLALASWQS